MYDRSARYYDVLYDSIKDYEAESRDLVGLIQELAPAARTLLDVGCGTGRHLEHLGASFEVAGVDASPEMVAIARERNPGVPIEVGDVRDLHLGHRFDAVTFLFSGIGYLLTPGDLAAGAKTIAEHLEPGGIAVVDGWLRPDAFDPAHALGGHVVRANDQVVARVDRHEVVGSLSVIEMAYTVASAHGIERFEERHTLAMWDRADYGRAFTPAGLRIEDVLEATPGRDRFILRR